jgi:flavin reductase (DIM6/NTAB) family NADH-FMN oxidoreductase RutF
MLRIDPKETAIPKTHRALLGAVGPRPIAFASTVDKNGIPNLSPFSFFNAFGANPATLVFSPSRRGRDNTTKHTYENLKEVPEVVINMVNFSMVEQMNLASTEYPKGVNEFVKSGLTAIKSEKIKPFRVKESPVQFECSVKQIIETGDQGGAGNLVICEVLLIHVDEKILDDKGNIDPQKIDLVGRLGGDYYCRASGDAVFKVEKPLQKLGIGIGLLPDYIKYSKYLTGNDLGKLGNVESLPDPIEIEEFLKKSDYSDEYHMKNNEKEKIVFDQAKRLLSQNKVTDALKLMMGLLA